MTWAIPFAGQSSILEPGPAPTQEREPEALYPALPATLQVQECRDAVKNMSASPHPEHGEMAHLFAFLLREAERGWVSQRRVRQLERQVEALESENENRQAVLADLAERVERIEKGIRAAETAPGVSALIRRSGVQLQEVGSA